MSVIRNFLKPFYSHQETSKGEVILTANGRLPLNCGNQNYLIIGGPGSGKTRSFVMPNLLQMYGSYVLGSSDDSVLRTCGRALEEDGYVIKVFDLSSEYALRRSLHYNPFAYISSESDIVRFVDILMAHTSGNSGQSSDSFWYAAEKLLLYALIGYISSCGGPEDKNFGTLLDIINSFDIREDVFAGTYRCPVDVLFENLAQSDPDCFAVRQYRKFKKAAEKTAKSIVISCAARLASFDLDAIRELMSYDELELDQLCDRKTALFIVDSGFSSHFNAVTAILYAQIFDRLIGRAKWMYGGKLPLHVSFYLDDASIYHLPHDFENSLAVLRGREISVAMMVQSVEDLQMVFGQKAELIKDICGVMLLMGKNGYKVLPKGAVSSRQLAWLEDRQGCIFMDDKGHIGISNKYKLKRHPRYSLTADANAKNGYVFNRKQEGKSDDPAKVDF